MIKALGWRLAHARVAGPLIITAIFLFCSTFGLAIGTLLKTEHTRFTELPVYPNTQSLTALSPGRIGSLSTPTATPITPPVTLTNFTFATSDTHEQVLAFYKQAMEHDFGMQLQGGDATTNVSDGVAIMRYLRAALYRNWTVSNDIVPSLWVLERVTITVDWQTPGVTRATVSLDVQPLP